MNQTLLDDDNLLIPAAPLHEGYNRIVGRGEKGLKTLEFGRLILTSGEWQGETGDCEMVIDIYSGSLSVEIELASGRIVSHGELGERDSIFGGQATAVIVPPRSLYRVIYEDGDVDAAVFTALACGDAAQAAVVRPNDVAYNVVGVGDWRRDVYTVIGNDAPTSMLLVGEVVNPGHWSGFPPHKHDTMQAPEIVMEEVYLFRMRPSQGYGIIRVYTERDDPHPFDRLYTVSDGDTVVIPRGYHPIASAPGYEMKYTYVLAGAGRRFGAWSEEARHSWMAQ